MRRTLFAGLALALAATNVCAQNPVFFTESPSTMGKGTIRIGLGIEYLTRDVSPSDGIPATLVRFLGGSIRGGVSENVNFDVIWRGGLLAGYGDGSSRFDWGDLFIWTKINLIGAVKGQTGLAFRTGIKLPSTRYNPGKLGNNQMDYHTQIIVSRSFGRHELRGMAGFSIIGDPQTAGSQDDVFSAAIASIHSLNEWLDIFVEMYGRKGYQDHDGKLVGRLGVINSSEAWTWSVYGLVRLAGDHYDFGSAFDCSETWSVGLFASRPVDLGL
ncbi:MAG: transporter [Ignavibacterium sp.]